VNNTATSGKETAASENNKVPAGREEIFVQGLHVALTAVAFAVSALLLTVAWSRGESNRLFAVVLGAICAFIAWDLTGDVLTLVRMLRKGKKAAGEENP